MFSTEHVTRLLDIANAGCSKGHVMEARAIYQGLLNLNPELVPARIGLAFSHIVTNEFAEGERILREEVLSAHPDDEDANVMLGLCHTLAGNTEAALEILGPLVTAHGPRSELAGMLMERARE